MKQKKWVVYILRCRDRTLYTGITLDLKRRVQEHNRGIGAKYTKGRGPSKLLWSKGGFTESKAKSEESRIKKLTRRQKLEFIS